MTVVLPTPSGFISNVVPIGPGAFNFQDKPVTFDTRTTYRGAGMERTWLRSSYLYTPQVGASFIVQDRTVLEDMWLDATLAPIGLQSACTGPELPGLEGITATYRRCRISGRGHCVESWAGPGNTLILEDCIIEGARWLVVNGNSAGLDKGGTIILRRCTLIGISLNTLYTGDQSRGLVGLVNRSGRIQAYNCNWQLQGDPRIIYVAGAWNDPGSDGHSEAITDLYDCDSQVDAGGCPFAVDSYQQTGTINRRNGSGMGPNFGWQQITTAPVPGAPITPVPDIAPGISA